MSAAAAEPGSPAIDIQHPWLGLASFTEETRDFFFGRDEEVAELARRVQRKLLTILFGKSGLGKTSILRAGLVPRLRQQGYCPVYVRIAYGRDTPEPAEQIKEAIRRAADQAGEWTRSGVAAAGESLWEFLHHRDDVLRDAAGHTLTPLLIFDQFEELFTLAQSDEFGRARAARFVEELADLVENRPPHALEARLETDEHAAEQFDFARSDYRVLIALREDYLAPLESLKKVMPGVVQNRLRIAPMTGSQALAAVLRPGKGLVSEEVAAAIVRFVAGGAELANAEVEPSLLSLICRELNDARLAKGGREISLDLLAGSHATILSTFYERSLADQPAAVRRIIEDELLTESGFRENVAEENLLRRFREVGAGPESLALLVDRRLLRIEERLDVRRVELTHDVLCGVVKESRDQRHAREAREAAERALQEQRERALAARHALQRVRGIAAGCVLLAVAAVFAAGFAYFSAQRAQRAEQQAQHSRAVADQARANAEHLLGWLTDDFVRELESFGRLNVVAEFAQRQIDYFHGLPVDLRSAETVRNGAQALVTDSRALRILGDVPRATSDANEAVQLLESLRERGDVSEATSVGLAQAYLARCMILDNQNDPQGPLTCKQALGLLKPFATAAAASEPARRAYVQLLTRLAYEDQNLNVDNAEAVRAGREAMRIAGEFGATQLADFDMAAYYAESGAWTLAALVNMGRVEEARKLGNEIGPLAERVLQQRPGYRVALHAKQLIESTLGSAEQNDLRLAEAERYARLAAQTSLAMLQLDPNNLITVNNLGAAKQSLGDALWAMGRLRDAIGAYQEAVEQFGKVTSGGASFYVVYALQVSTTGYRQAQMGDFAGAAAAVERARPLAARLRQASPDDAFLQLLVDLFLEYPACVTDYEQDHYARSLEAARHVLERVQSARTGNAFQDNQRYYSVAYYARLAGQAAYNTGDDATAEQMLSIALKARRAVATDAISDRRELGELSTWLAMTLAREHKSLDALKLIEPVIDFQRQLAARNHGDAWLPQELAAALYAKSLASPAARGALLSEAGQLIGHLPPQIRGLRDVRRWSSWIEAAAARSAASRVGSGHAPPV